MTTRSNTRSFWEEKDYGAPASVDPDSGLECVAPATRMFLRPLLPVLRGKTVLDLGCGSGYLTPLLAPACERLVGLDFSESAIQAARKRCSAIPNATFVAGDVLDVDLGQRFDVIVGRLFLHEIMHDDTPLLLQRLDSMLAPGGFICFHENSLFNPFARLFRAYFVGRFGVPKHGSEHELPFDRARFEMYSGHFRHCERYVDGVEFFQKLHQYLIPSKNAWLARGSATLDHCLEGLQSRSGLLNDWSYTQTIYASQTVSRPTVFGRRGPPGKTAIKTCRRPPQFS